MSVFPSAPFNFYRSATIFRSSLLSHEDDTNFNELSLQHFQSVRLPHCHFSKWHDDKRMRFSLNSIIALAMSYRTTPHPFTYSVQLRQFSWISSGPLASFSKWIQGTLILRSFSGISITFRVTVGDVFGISYIIELCLRGWCYCLGWRAVGNDLMSVWGNVKINWK